MSEDANRVPGSLPQADFLSPGSRPSQMASTPLPSARTSLWSWLLLKQMSEGSCHCL